MTSKKRTLVIGASENPHRYSHKAIRSLLKKGIDVVAIGKREGQVEHVNISTQVSEEENIDTVSLYINPNHQNAYEDILMDLKPKRVIFNPGTENPNLENKLKSKGIQTLKACTLVMLASNQY